MNESRKTIQEEIDDLIEKHGPLEIDEEAVQRTKEAEKKKRLRHRVDRSSGGK